MTSIDSFTVTYGSTYQSRITEQLIQESEEELRLKFETQTTELQPSTATSQESDDDSDLSAEDFFGAPLLGEEKLLFIESSTETYVDLHVMSLRRILSKLERSKVMMRDMCMDIIFI